MISEVLCAGIVNSNYVEGKFVINYFPRRKPVITEILFYLEV